jgi:glutathione synthase/RimK-type ligase-like ATP-grasp enzyme
MIVVIVSSMHDAHVGTVMRALMARPGIGVELLDQSRFPNDLAISMRFSGGERHFAIGARDASTVNMCDVGAIWWRRPQSFGLPAESTGEAVKRFTQSEATAAFHGMYQSLNAFWINRPDHDVKASHKPWQLSVAQESGLEIPSTLITSDPDAARAFWREHNGDVIHKQFVALPGTWRETRRLRPDDESLADAISLAPVIFQEYVEAVAELRITIVGQRVFAAAVNLGSASYPADVRFNLDLCHEIHSLPADITERLLALMDKLSLEYAAIDMRLTPDGRYVFLEANPAGQFLHVEQTTGLKISEAIAESLASCVSVC